jgi:hypothetical protein
LNYQSKSLKGLLLLLPKLGLKQNNRQRRMIKENQADKPALRCGYFARLFPLSMVKTQQSSKVLAADEGAVSRHVSALFSSSNKRGGLRRLWSERPKTRFLGQKAGMDRPIVASFDPIVATFGSIVAMFDPNVVSFDPNVASFAANLRTLDANAHDGEPEKGTL